MFLAYSPVIFHAWWYEMLMFFILALGHAVAAWMPRTGCPGTGTQGRTAPRTNHVTSALALASVSHPLARDVRVTNPA